MAMKKFRNMKVYEQSGYQYKSTPAIMLKGMWLKEFGFEIGDYISVVCEDGKLVITSDTERAELEKAEVEIMENERKAMKKRVKERRRELLERRVAESQIEYGTRTEE